MPGTILGAVAKQQIADCHIRAIKDCSTRECLIAIYRASRTALGKGELMDSVNTALAARAKVLGIYKEGGKKNA